MDQNAAEQPDKPLISEDDCRTIISNKYKQENKTCIPEVTAFKLFKFPEKRGLLGEHYQLTIETNSKDSRKTHNFFVKTLPEFPDQKVFAMETGAFFKEHQFFTKIIPHMQQVGIQYFQEFIPKCFLNRLYEVGVFDDVEIQGYATLPQRPCLSLDCVSMVITAMAKLHGACYVLEELVSKKIEKPYRMIDEYRKEFAESFYSTSDSSVKLRQSNQRTIVTEIDLFPNPNSKLGADCLKKLAVDYIGGYNDWVKPSNKFRNTICHGDLWASNIMFKFEGGKLSDCKMIDFQSYRYLPPAHDLLCFLYLSTDRKFRDKHKETVLELYFNQLKEVMANFGVDVETVLSRQKFYESCKEYQLFAACQSCTHFTSVMLSKKQLTELFSNPEYNRKIFFEDRSDLVVKTCAIDCEYRRKLEESVMDLWESFEMIMS